jgi:hypothetical protein
MNFRGAYLGVLALAGGALPLLANAPETSLRPEERVFAVRYTHGGSPLAPARSLRPVLRSAQGEILDGGSDQIVTGPAGGGGDDVLILAAVRQSSGFAPLNSLRPDARPDNLPTDTGTVTEAGLFGPKKPPRRGSVCGDRHIRGEPVGRVPGRISGCGVKDAVRVSEVSGVRLSTPAVMDCTTAAALKDWVDDGLQPAFRRMGQVTQMKVAAHYACRTRNNLPGARISEHGKGRAIDLSAFTLQNGQVVSVLGGWRRGSTGKALKKAHASACGPFGTVLGPEADRFHKDHFHFDTARHRGGPYCR